MPITSIVQRCAFKVGGLIALADALGCTRNTFYSWKVIPPHRVLQLEKITKISRHELRPDLYPLEKEKRHERTKRRGRAS